MEVLKIVTTFGSLALLVIAPFVLMYFFVPPLFWYGVGGAFLFVLPYQVGEALRNPVHKYAIASKGILLAITLLYFLIFIPQLFLKGWEYLWATHPNYIVPAFPMASYLVGLYLPETKKKENIVPPDSSQTVSPESRELQLITNHVIAQYAEVMATRDENTQAIEDYHLQWVHFQFAPLSMLDIKIETIKIAIRHRLEFQENTEEMRAFLITSYSELAEFISDDEFASLLKSEDHYEEITKRVNHTKEEFGREIDDFLAELDSREMPA